EERVARYSGVHEQSAPGDVLWGEEVLVVPLDLLLLRFQAEAAVGLVLGRNSRIPEGDWHDLPPLRSCYRCHRRQTFVRRFVDVLDVERQGRVDHVRVAAAGADKLAVWARAVRTKLAVAQHRHGPATSRAISKVHGITPGIRW